MAGKRADAAYWYEVEGGRFITSSHYMDAAPAWLEAWNARRLPDSFAGRPWERLLPDHGLYRQYAGADAVAGEWDNKDTVFPHRIPWLPPADDFYDGLERTPFADTILLEFALAAMAGHHLGEGDATDLLAISFSACDVVGHTYGPDSQEMMDQMLRLDRALGLFLDEVDRRAGEGGSIVVLTADHGVMPLVENLQAQGIPAAPRARGGPGADRGRRARRALPRRARPARGHGRARVGARHGGDRAPGPEARGRRADGPRARPSAPASWTRSTRRPSSMGPAPAGDPFFELHQRAFFAPRSGDLIGRVKPYVYLTSRKYTGGTGHGTPYDYDRHVPIVFMAPGIPPGKRDVACGPEDIAWALGRLLGLDYPKQDAATDLLPYLK